MRFNSQSTENKRKELPNEVRMLMAFVLMGIILLGTPWVYNKLGILPKQPAQTEKTASVAPKSAAAYTPEAAGAASASGTPMTPAAPTTAAAEPAAGKVAGAAEQEQVVDTSLYHVVFSNKGAVVTSWILKNTNTADGKPLDVVNEVGSAKVAWPFSFTSQSDKPFIADLNRDLWAVHRDGLTLRFDYSDGATVASKTFVFQPDGAIVNYSDNLTESGAGVQHQIQWRAGFGDLSVHNAAAQQATVFYNTATQKLVRQPARSAKNGPVFAEGSFSFAGIDDQYFAGVFLPRTSTQVHVTTYSDTVATRNNSEQEAYPGVAVGGEAENRLETYIGPKEISTLRNINPKLEGLIDWGWFGFIAKPFFLILRFLNDNVLHNYGWAIVVLAVFINLAQFPLKISSMKSMRKMQALQPELKAINEKYKGIGMSDPRAANKQQEMMDLYKKNGVNPMGGCLPLLIQLPFLYAFYRVIAVTVELRHAPWLWVRDLSQPEHFALHPLPLIMVVTSFILQKMTPTPAGADPNQQRMMQFMPLMYLFFFWYQSAGLVLYWLTNNLVGIAQQWFFNKTMVPAVVTAPAVQPPRRATTGRKRA